MILTINIILIILADKSRPEPSKLQLSVVQSLTEALQANEDLQVANEYSGFGNSNCINTTTIFILILMQYKVVFSLSMPQFSKVVKLSPLLR